MLLIAVCLLAVFSSMFIVADHFGYTDEKYAQAELEKLHASENGQYLAAAVIVGLLAIDLLLPVPSSIVMSVSGMMFGAALGTLIGFAGSMLAAGLGFYACRWGGRRAFQKLIGSDDITAIDAWFQDYGVYAIVLSRPVPMMTEILSCLAGLTDIPARTFFLASALGHLPVCLIYAWFGSVSSIANPWPAACVALLIPALGWVVVRRIKRQA
jgi:uncharacterized membrane protein YdjX (TVP38/TMEM64 family)